MTGWTPDYVENNMTIAWLEALQREWEYNPPQHTLLAILAQSKGWKPKSRRPKDNKGAALDLARSLGGM